MVDDEVTYSIIIPDDTEYSLDELENGEVEGFSHLIRQGGRYSWTLQTFCYLKEQGMSVKLSHGLDPDCINMAHGNFLREAGKCWDSFSVSLQGDYPRFPLAHFHFVQNKCQEKSNAAFLPYWP